MLIRLKVTPRSMIKMRGGGSAWNDIHAQSDHPHLRPSRSTKAALILCSHSLTPLLLFLWFSALNCYQIPCMTPTPTPLSLSLSYFLSLPLSFRKNPGSRQFTEIQHISLYYVYKNAFPPKWQCVLSQSCLLVPGLVTCRVSTSSFLPSFLSPFLLML